MQARDLILPRGMTSGEVAEYLGITPAAFRAMVKRGEAPRPIPLTAHRCQQVWDRRAIDAWIDALTAGVPDAAVRRPATDPMTLAIKGVVKG